MPTLDQDLREAAFGQLLKRVDWSKATVQAGREVRIVVKPEALDDLACIQLSRDIAKRIEESMEYPGQIKVTVVRETRAVEYAK